MESIRCCHDATGGACFDQEVSAMEMLWPLPIFLLAAMALIAVYAIGPRLVAGSVLARRAFFCPFRQQDVSVDFRQAAWDGRRTDVQACTAFTPPTAVGCDKACLALERLPEAPSPAS
jgi:hypothetical protein